MRIFYALLCALALAPFTAWTAEDLSPTAQAGSAATAAEAAPSGPPNWRLQLEGYLASGSRFDEYPKDGTADKAAGARVHGPMATTYGGAGLDARLWRGLWIGASYHMGSIATQTMNLDQQSAGAGRADLRNEIGGLLTRWDLELALRLLESGPSWRSWLELHAGWGQAGGTKQFYDGGPKGGAVAYPGNFGRFIIDYGGPSLGLRGQWEALKGLGLRAGLLGSPSLSNRTRVEGSHLTAPIEDQAVGRRYRWEAGAFFAPGGGAWELAGGYRYEDVYFDPTAKSYSLNIIYAGPWAQAAFRF